MANDTRAPLGPIDTTVRSRRWYHFGILGVLFFLSAIVVAYLLTDVRDKMAELASSPHDNVQWTLTQLEVEYLTFANQVERADALNNSDPMTPDLADLRRRYDILYARIRTIREGTLYEPAISGGNIEAEFDEVATKIFAMANVIDQPDSRLLADLSEIKAQLDALHPLVRRILTVGNRGLAYYADSTRAEMSDVLIRLAAAAAVLLVTLTALTLLFRKEASVSDTRLRENLATSARLETIFSTSRDAILVIDRAGRILNINRAGIEMFATQMDGGELPRIDKLLAREHGSELIPVTGAQLFNAAASGRQTGLRVAGFRLDCSQFPVEISIDTSLRPRTAICVAVIRDISHQVEVEEELKTSRDDARAGERAKARFLGVISHEMRTPLNGILGAIELIERDEPGSIPKESHSLQTYLPVLKTSSKALLTLVDDVLDLTQIEDGPKLLRQEFDLDELLSDIVLAGAPGAEQMNSSIKLIPSAHEIGRVKGDPGRLRQIITNLIANAIKFTKNGEITLEVNRTEGNIVEIQVMDTGLGMEPDEINYVFDDFFRTDTAIQNQVQGTGLGLGIAKTLVHAMGGDITAESEKGEGSVFTVCLPLPAVKGATPTTFSTNGQKTHPRANNKLPVANILVVEDNATNRLIARGLLENEGHNVIEALNGQEGLRRCAEAKFDLILMDISMPEMDGPTAANKIRSTPGPNQKTRIVALTAHVTQGLETDHPLESMDAILHKPLDCNKLNNQIKFALGLPVQDTAPNPVSQSALPDLVSILPAATAQRLIDAFLRETDRDLPILLNRSDPTKNTPDSRLAGDLHALAGAAASLGVTPLHGWLITAEKYERMSERTKSHNLVKTAASQWPRLRDEILRHRDALL